MTSAVSGTRSTYLPACRSRPSAGVTLSSSFERARSISLCIATKYNARRVFVIKLGITPSLLGRGMLSGTFLLMGSACECCLRASCWGWFIVVRLEAHRDPGLDCYILPPPPTSTALPSSLPTLALTLSLFLHPNSPFLYFWTSHST